jgi:hypothetical protein
MFNVLSTKDGLRSSMELDFDEMMKDAAQADALNLASSPDISEQQQEEEIKFCPIKSYMTEQTNKIHVQDDSFDIKQRLMRLVAKGREEGIVQKRAVKSLLDQAKTNNEMNSKAFL